MNQSNSPAFYGQPLTPAFNSNNPPSVLQPQSVNSIQQPHSVNSLQQPHSVNSIQQPHSVSNIQQPHSVNNLQQPQSVNSLTTAAQSAPNGSNGHTFSLDFTNSSTNFNNFDLNSLVSNFQYEFGQDEVPEPVMKSKELFNQLKVSIQSLFTQLSFILNPQNEPNKQLSDHQLQLLGKHIESFNKTCDLLTVNLRSACEAQLLSNELRQVYRYYAHIDRTDIERNEGQMLNSMNIQMQRIGELKMVLQKFLTVREHDMSQLQYDMRQIQQNQTNQNQSLPINNQVPFQNYNCQPPQILQGAPQQQIPQGGPQQAPQGLQQSQIPLQGQQMPQQQTPQPMY